MQRACREQFRARPFTGSRTDVDTRQWVFGRVDVIDGGEWIETDVVARQPVAAVDVLEVREGRRFDWNADGPNRGRPTGRYQRRRCW